MSEAQKRGRINKQKGQRKQRLARKGLGIPNPKYASQMGHEENWSNQAFFDTEVKAGKQVESYFNKYFTAETQSKRANYRTGGRGLRPFIFVAMPDDMTDGLVTFRLKDLENVVDSFITTWQQESSPFYKRWKNLQYVQDVD